MEVILLEELKGLGARGALVNVKPGYARNYLLPQKLAIMAGDKAANLYKELERQKKLHDDKRIVQARAISEGTVANMKQNLGFAFLYNALGVPIAAGVLYPVFGLLLSPMIAALAMSLSSVSVVTNALRLGRTTLPESLSDVRRPEPAHDAACH